MNPSDCGVAECDRDAPIMRRPWPTSAPLKKSLRRVGINQLFAEDLLITETTSHLSQDIGFFEICRAN
jgi:hypothetical protein